MPNQDHATRIAEALERYRLLNKQPAVDEPANDFEKSVNDLHELQELMKILKDLMKPLETDERKARDGIAESLRTFFGSELKEGINNYELSNFRKVKFTHKVQRDVDSSMLAVARDQYAAADDVPEGVTFDSLLRVKHELVAAPFKKLPKGGASSLAVSRMLTTKFAAPTVAVD